ncbi:hypothetical protein B0H15DRAFT_1004617 [Mycena belliarum]|uniref:Uncharacterized protein n=1 Tax=Mycena belliarum TaxID=1033014 RepID=A0AAD6XIB6_9AGAR|nr:hypothetical protein B0H15DRAFT_1004617 [Mycena belliae]
MSLHHPTIVAPTPTPPTSRTLTADGAMWRAFLEPGSGVQQPAPRASPYLDERDGEAGLRFPPSLPLPPPLARSASVSSVSSGTFHSLALTPPPTHARPGLLPRASSFHSHAFGTSGSASSIFDGAEDTTHTNTNINNAALRFENVRPPFGTRASSFHSHAFGAARSAPNSIYSQGGTPPVHTPEAGCDAAYGLDVASHSSLVLTQSVDMDAEPALARPPSQASGSDHALLGPAGPVPSTDLVHPAAKPRLAPRSSSAADEGVDPLQPGADVHATVSV